MTGLHTARQWLLQPTTREIFQVSQVLGQHTASRTTGTDQYLANEHHRRLFGYSPSLNSAQPCPTYQGTSCTLACHVSPPQQVLSTRPIHQGTACTSALDRTPSQQVLSQTLTTHQGTTRTSTPSNSTPPQQVLSTTPSTIVPKYHHVLRHPLKHYQQVQ